MWTREDNTFLWDSSIGAEVVAPFKIMLATESDLSHRKSNFVKGVHTSALIKTVPS